LNSTIQECIVIGNALRLSLKKIYIDKEAYPEQRDLFLKEVEAIPFEDYT
jgi:hypothetical protein